MSPAAMKDRLARLVRRSAPTGTPVQFGPQYCCPAPKTLTLTSGRLAGTSFSFRPELSDQAAAFLLYGPGSDLAAQCHFDRDPATGLETMLDIVVRPDLRGHGLAALLTRLSFRHLFATGRRHWPRLRKLMVIDRTHAERIDTLHWGVANHDAIQNLGIGLVALRLGFVPEPGVEDLFRPGNVQSVVLLAARPGTPPSLLINLNSLPRTVACLLIDPATGRPAPDPAAYEHFFSPLDLARRARSARALLGNVDYVLGNDTIIPFAARIADDRLELGRFVAALRRGQRL